MDYTASQHLCFYYVPGVRKSVRRICVMFIHLCIWGVGVGVGTLFNDLSVSVRITSLVRESPLTASLLCTGKMQGARKL